MWSTVSACFPQDITAVRIHNSVARDCVTAKDSIQIEGQIGCTTPSSLLGSLERELCAQYIWRRVDESRAGVNYSDLEAGREPTWSGLCAAARPMSLYIVPLLI